MNLYVIAGEASGDLHASNLVRAYKKLDPQAEVRAWGGDMLQEAGATLVKHYRELAFMGFKEVIANLPTILRNIRFCKEDIEAFGPDAIIFVDYPGFNLRIAGWARKKGYKTIYYISPQLWAWKAGRVKQIKRDIDRMMVILPFEEAFYGSHEYQVDYVGHPLLDVTEKFIPPTDFNSKNGLSNKPLIALLPGSRKQEIGKMLPIMTKVAEHFPAYQFVIAGAPGQDEELYQQYTLGKDIKVIFGQTYPLLSSAEAALVTSGTATLEAALFEVPEVVCYKGSRMSFWIGKRLVKVPFISLVNLIMGHEVVKELIQNELTTDNCRRELESLLTDPACKQKMQEDYRLLKAKLGGEGASERAAEVVRGVVNS